jgi:hypothetical protein
MALSCCVLVSSKPQHSTFVFICQYDGLCDIRQAGGLEGLRPSKNPIWLMASGDTTGHQPDKVD